jgi:hypothetical protein
LTRYFDAMLAVMIVVSGAAHRPAIDAWIEARK